MSLCKLIVISNLTVLVYCKKIAALFLLQCCCLCNSAVVNTCSVVVNTCSAVVNNCSAVVNIVVL